MQSVIWWHGSLHWDSSFASCARPLCLTACWCKLIERWLRRAWLQSARALTPINEIDHPRIGAILYVDFARCGPSYRLSLLHCNLSSFDKSDELKSDGETADDEQLEALESDDEIADEPSDSPAVGPPSPESNGPQTGKYDRYLHYVDFYFLTFTARCYA